MNIMHSSIEPAMYICMFVLFGLGKAEHLSKSDFLGKIYRLFPYITNFTTKIFYDNSSLILSS